MTTVTGITPPVYSKELRRLIEKRVSRLWKRYGHPMPLGTDVTTTQPVQGWVLCWSDGGDEDDSGTVLYGPHPWYVVDAYGRLFRCVSPSPPPGDQLLYELLPPISLSTQESRYIVRALKRRR